MVNNGYPLVNIQKAIEHGPFIVELPIKNGWIFLSIVFCKRLPEGKSWFHCVQIRWNPDTAARKIAKALIGSSWNPLWNPCSPHKSLSKIDVKVLTWIPLSSFFFPSDIEVTIHNFFVVKLALPQVVLSRYILDKCPHIFINLSRNKFHLFIEYLHFYRECSNFLRKNTPFL